MDSEEILPRELFEEIARYTNGGTSVNLLFTSKWMSKVINPVTFHIDNRRDFRRACHRGDVWSILRSNEAIIEGARIRYGGLYQSIYVDNTLAEWMLEGFRIACIKGHLELAQFLYKINDGKYISSPYFHGHAYLSRRTIHYNNVGFKLACWKGHTQITKWLLECGADNYDEGIKLASMRNNTSLIELIFSYIR